MTAQSGGAFSAKGLLFATGGALAIGAGAVFVWQQNKPAQPGAEPASLSAPLSGAVDTAAAPDTPSQPRPSQPMPAQPEAGFDVVRVDPEGRAVIAGHATPDSRVQLTLDGAALEQVDVGQDGKFVALLNLPVDAPAALGLATLDETGAQITPEGSPQTVLIAPVPNPPAAPATTSAVSQDGTDTAAAAPMAADAPSLAAPQVLLADDQGITVLQDAQPALENLPQVSQVVIDAISYDATGDVALSGRGTQGAALRVYLDNQPVQSGAVTASGQWRVPLPTVDSGIYTLRVDELGPDGAVTSRMETPFKREEPAKLASAQPNPPDKPAEAITVQPGSTLWAIARDHLGDGPLYVRVFAANRDKIRDPDLIYPGQVFAIPEGQ